MKKTKDMRYLGKGILLSEYKAIRRRGVGFDGALKLPLPQNDAELEVLSLYVFGRKLHLKELSTSRYEVLEDHYSYYDSKFNEALNCFNSYAVDSDFWGTVIGTLSCGGIARASYGSIKDVGYRQKRRLERWVRSRDKGGKALRGVRNAFVRLAAHRREQREQDYSR